MKVLNLQCGNQHFFEGWFASEDEFQSQLGRGLMECPMCGSNSVHKMPSAPRLNLGGHPRSEKLPAQTAEERNRNATHQMDMRSHTALSPLSQKAAEDNSVNGSPLEQAAFLQALRHVVATTENVGKKFAEEVRRMHYGDIEARRIRGQASARQAMELLEEGIEVLALPMLPAIKETLQ